MENNFNFKSQICTTREQSERLLALGLKKETADCYYWQECDKYGDPNGKWHLDILNDDTREHFEYLLNHFGICLHIEDALFIPAWSLHRLIETIQDVCSRILMVHSWVRIENRCMPYIDYPCDSFDNTYDNIISCIEWLIKEGDFNKDYLV